MISEIEPGTVTAAPNLDSDGVVLEGVDAEGRGFRTLLDFNSTLDLVQRLIGSIGRLRRLGDLPP